MTIVRQLGDADLLASLVLHPHLVGVLGARQQRLRGLEVEADEGGTRREGERVADVGALEEVRAPELVGQVALDARARLVGPGQQPPRVERVGLHGLLEVEVDAGDLRGRGDLDVDQLGLVQALELVGSASMSSRPSLGSSGSSWKARSVNSTGSPVRIENIAAARSNRVAPMYDQGR